MSEASKRKPVSVYLTPKASKILEEFHKHSGYSSLSRTVEEIILSFNSTYNTVKDNINLLKSKLENEEHITDGDKVALFLVLYSTLKNLDNTISRLQLKNGNSTEVER